MERSSAPSRTRCELEPFAYHIGLRDLPPARFCLNVGHQWFGQPYGESLHEVTVLQRRRVCKTQPTAAAHKWARIIFHLVTTRQEFDNSHFAADHLRFHKRQEAEFRAKPKPSDSNLFPCNRRCQWFPCEIFRKILWSSLGNTERRTRREFPLQFTNRDGGSLNAGCGRVIGSVLHVMVTPGEKPTESFDGGAAQ